MLERIAYSASQTFSGRLSADENLAANTANGAGLEAYSILLKGKVIIR